MNRTRKIIAAGLALVGALAFASPSRFTSKVPYDPLVAKLKASGGDTARILYVRSRKDLQLLESGKRYKFVLDAAGSLAMCGRPRNSRTVH